MIIDFFFFEEDDEKTSTFTGFVKNVMPDFYEEEENELIKKTLHELYSDKNVIDEEKNDEPK